MEHSSGTTRPENMLSIAQYTIELFRPGHKFATVNLEEIIAALRHDIKTRSTRLKCVSVPLSVHRTMIPNCVYNNESVFDYDSCAVVGSQAAVALGVPVSGSCWVLLSNCECVVNSKVEQSFVCRSPKHSVKDYAVQVIASRHLPPQVIVLNEEMYHNTIKFLYGPKSTLDDELFVSVRRCENRVNRTAGNNGLKFMPQMAIRAVVSCIDMPNLEDNDILTACLSNYFRNPHHIHRGDIFRIDIKENAPEAVFSCRNYNLHLYFVVQKLEGQPYKNVKNADRSIGYIIGQGVTTLLQDQNSQSFIPSSKTLDLCNTRTSGLCKDSLISRCPPAFINIHDELISCIRLFLFDAPAGLKATFLLTGPNGSGKSSLISSVASHLGLHIWTVDCSEIQGATSGQTEGKLRAVFSKAKQYAPCIFILSNIDILCKDQDGMEDFRTIEEFQEQIFNLNQCNFPVIVIGTSLSSNSLSSSLSRIFLQEFSMNSLGKNECETLLHWLMSQFQMFSNHSCIETVASRCSGFLFADAKELANQAVRNHIDGHLDSQGMDCTHELSLTDFEKALDKMQSAYAGAIGAPKVPSVKWSDVGGLGKVKEEILRTITMPLKHPELISAGLRRSGILLYGPPGTGKTLIAKAVATECNLNFLSVKGPELLNMYVGQSEANVREVFERAREAAPCIIFFDELDSLAPSRGRSGDSGGVMDRVVSQLLSEMDGLQKSNLLFVIGATNRPDLVDPALLRPGRFDKLLYIGACEDKESRIGVLTALTRKFTLNKDVDLNILVEEMPTRVTGADMYAVCSEAWMGAVRRLIKSSGKVENQDLPSIVEVSNDDFRRAIAGMVPSVSAEDMAYFKSLQKELSKKK